MQGLTKEQIVQQAVVGAVKQVEAAVDDEINRLDNLAADDLEAIRRKRLAEMKKAAEERQKWRSLGHGQLRAIKERDFFQHAKESERFVCVMHRKDQSRLGQDFLDHIARIAEHHEETMFASLDAEAAPFLSQKFKIRVLPSVCFIKNSEMNKVLHGLSELDPTGTGNFDTARLEQSLFDMEAIKNTTIGDNS